MLDGSWNGKGPSERQLEHGYAVSAMVAIAYRFRVGTHYLIET